MKIQTHFSVGKHLLSWYSSTSTHTLLCLLKYSSFFSFVYCRRVINVWNSLPADVDFSIANLLKRSVNRIDFSYFLRQCLYIVFMCFTVFI